MSAASPPPFAWPHSLRALAHRPYRRYFIGQLISLHGTWMQSVAQSWLVYRLTGSSLMLGLVSFVSLAPVLFFGLWGGVLADRLPRRGLFIAAQVLALLQALTLAGLTWSGAVSVAWVLGLAALLGLVHALEMPVRHAYIAGLVPREDLACAVAINSGTFNLARFLGPAIAGLVIAHWGEAPAFAINALSFAAVILALSGLPATPADDRRRGGVLDGLRHVRGDPCLRRTLLRVVSASLIGVPYLVLMPVFAEQVFGGGPQTLGWLMGGAGLGALLAALRLATHRDAGARLPHDMREAGILGGLGLQLFALTPWLPAALPLTAVIGFALTTLVASANTYLQLHAPDGLRGRVMAVFSVAFIGLAPVGNLLAGALAEVLGAGLTVALFGGCLALLHWLSPLPLPGNGSHPD